MENKILLKRKEFLNPTKDSKGIREKYLVDLRKKKKQDIFRAKRAIRILEKNDEEAQKDLRVTDTGIVQSDGVLSDTMQEYSTILEKMCPSLFQDTDSLGGKLQIVKEALEADDLEPKVYIALCTYIRILCCIGDLIHIEDVINAELFPLIMKMGSAESVTELMIEITWILVNITSSENKEIYEYILRPEFGLISYCKTMLRNSEEKVVTNTLWILANISQEGAPYDEILDTDVIDVIQEILNSAKVTLNLLRVIAHCLSNLAKCPKRNLEFLHILIENSATILYIQDEEAQFDWMFCLKILTEREEYDKELEFEKLKSIQNSNILERVFQFLEPENRSFNVCLRVLGNLCSSEWPGIHNAILKQGFFPKASELISQKELHPQKQKELFWITSNLVTCGAELAYEYFSSTFFQQTLKYIEERPYSDIKREACWCIWNLIESADLELKMDLVSKYSILTLLNIILKESQTQGKLMEAILTAISRILDTAKHFQQDDPFHPLFNFQSEGGTDILEELQHSPNVQIFTLASNIIKTHYSTEDEGEVFSEQN